jgi:hypothetical protein
MKKYILLIIAIALTLCGCQKEKSSQDVATETEEPKESVAKDATWDFFLLGTWKYAEQAPKGAKLSPYPKGMETFYSNGEWANHTMTAKGQKVLLKGTWKLDDKDQYVVWVTQTEGISDGGKAKKTGTNKVKYVIVSLTPGTTLNYMAGDCFRQAEYIK